MESFFGIDLEELKEFLSDESNLLLSAMLEGYSVTQLYRGLKVPFENVLPMLLQMGEELALYRMAYLNLETKNVPENLREGYNLAIQNMIKEVQMSKASKAETMERRKKVKELVLKGVTGTTELAESLGVCTHTILEDLKWINNYYLKLCTNNTNIVEKQVQRVSKLLDEIDLVKSEYWDILEKLKKDDTPENKTYVVGLEKGLDKLDDALLTDDETKAEQAIASIKMYTAKLRGVKRNNSTQKLQALKGILDRVEKEAKILGLFNPQTLIVNNFITKDNLKDILETMREIIFEFVPEDKRGYAIERMKGLEIKEMNGQEILDAELIDE